MCVCVCVCVCYFLKSQNLVFSYCGKFFKEKKKSKKLSFGLFLYTEPQKLAPPSFMKFLTPYYIEESFHTIDHLH